MLRTSLWVALAATLGGCATGQRHAYTGVVPEITVSSPAPVAIAVHDRRPYVVSGEKPATFVGLSRGGFGNPFDVNTASLRPLADDFRTTIAAALQRNGIEVREVSIPPQQEDGRQPLLQSRQRRSMLVTLRHWKCDIHGATTLEYDVQLKVFDQSGKIIAEKLMQGSDDVGGSLFSMNPVAVARERVPLAYKTRLEGLLSSAEVKKALQ